MRARRAFLVIKEYLDANEPVQVRKNALTAMAALGDPECLATVADVALNDQSPEVRERAESEILSRAGRSGMESLLPILEALKDPVRRRNAYTLLGRLRNRGVKFQLPKAGLLARLRLAKGLRDQLFPKRSVRFYLRTLTGILLGATAAAVALSLFLAHLLGTPAADHYAGLFIALVLISWLITVVVAVPATLFTSPAQLQADTGAAALLDMTMAAAASLVFTGITVGLLSFDESTRPPLKIQLFVIFAAPLTAAAVRWGTLSAFGLLRSRRWNRWLQILIGGSCGLAICDLIMMASGDTGIPFLSMAWIWIFFAGYGLAGAFASIDSKSADSKFVPRPVLSRVPRASGFALASAAILIAGVAMLPLRPFTMDAGRISPAPKFFELRQVPATLHFTSAHPAAVHIDDIVNYKAEWKPAGTRPDEYRAIIARNSYTPATFDFYSNAPQLTKLLSWPQLRARIARTPPVSGPVLVKVIIAPKEPEAAKPPARTTSKQAGK